MKKIFLWCFSILFIISAPIFMIGYIYPQKIVQIYHKDYYISDALLWERYSQSLSDEQYEFSGWVVYPGEEQGYPVLDNKSIWLYNQQTEVFYKLKSQQSSVRDYSVSGKVDDGLDYQSSAFATNVNLKSLSLEDNIYEIYICYQLNGTNYLVKTDSVIKYGILDYSRGDSM